MLDCRFGLTAPHSSKAKTAVTHASFWLVGKPGGKETIDPNLGPVFVSEAVPLICRIFEPHALTRQKVCRFGLRLQSSSDRSSVTIVVSYFDCAP